jgi:CRP/FNR family cyclic AMP-dependent transcriptional regulator
MQLEPLTRSLAEHPFVSGMSPSDVEFLAGCTKNVRIAGGEFLFREGAVASMLYLLREGRVSLESHAATRGSVTLETLGPGEVLGWRALFESYQWHLDGRATEPVLVFAVDGHCLKAKLEREPAFGFAVTRRLLFQAHQRLERARLQQLDVYRAER